MKFACGLIGCLLPFFLGCEPSSPIHVRDLAGVLDGEAAATLETQLAEYEAQSGTFWFLHTQQSLEVPTIDALSLKLNDELQLGQAGMNNGGMIILTQRERQVRIEVQDGLAWQIPDTASAAIYAQIRPLLSAGDYAGAFQEAFTQLQILASAVPWELSYEGLEDPGLKDSQAIGQIIRFEGEALQLFGGAVRPDQQFSPSYRLEVVGASGKTAMLFFTSHMFQWLDRELVPGQPRTIYGRILGLEPLAIALLGLTPGS